jgi:GH24 family phage-related lysozyme (muramidase)
VSSVGDVAVPFAAATEVFAHRSLPAYGRRTKAAYPGVDALPADAQTALVSLVYNRGAAMDGDRRREMRDIVPLVQARDLGGIAAQLRSMKRLWDPAVAPGLITRREREAALVENAERSYADSELVKV